MADRSGNSRRRRPGLPLAWLVLLTLVTLAGPAPSWAGPYREYEIRFSDQLGAPATYGQAFLAVDWLIERYGSAKLLEFLGRFALQAEPREHWRTVFPIPYRQFGDEFRSRLEGLR